MKTGVLSGGPAIEAGLFEVLLVIFSRAKPQGLCLPLGFAWEEMASFTQIQRDNIYNATNKEGIYIIEAYIAALGMTEDEYWNDYAPREFYNLLLNSKVLKHQEQRNSIVDLDEVPIDIFDELYQKDKIATTIKW
ncbi:MAG: hypothetical protein FWG42_01120 [Clostridiales bacterium]|nr:hypothetical protein [Clostridiales bacterium]